MAARLGKSAADDTNDSVWQNLSLEQDVLLQVFCRLSGTKLVQVSGISKGWWHILTCNCRPWQSLDISNSQATSDSFALWLDTRGADVKHLSIRPPCDTASAHDPDSRCFLTSLEQLQSFSDTAGSCVETLQFLPPSVESVQARFATCVTPQDKRLLALTQLTQLKSLSIELIPVEVDAEETTGGFDLRQDIQIVLAEQPPISYMKLMRNAVCNIAASGSQGCFDALTRLHLSVICNQSQLDHIMRIESLEELVLDIDTSGHDSYHIDVCHIGRLVNLRRLSLNLICCLFRNAHMLQRLPALHQLSFSMTDDVAVLFRPEDGSSYNMPCLLSNLKHVELRMHSVFDVTDCLEGLQVVDTISSLSVSLQQSTSRGPSEVHWAIKEGSVLARAACLHFLKVECTSMLIKLLPPKLRSLIVSAREINVQASLKPALNMLEVCHLDAKRAVEYF